MNIFKACWSGDFEFVQNYIKSNNNINIIDKYNQTPLHIACINDNIEIVKLLLLNGVNINAVNEYNKTPLQYLNTENKQIINNFITALKFIK